MKNLFKRSLAVALALIMCVSMMNLTAFAANGETRNVETRNTIPNYGSPHHFGGSSGHQHYSSGTAYKLKDATCTKPAQYVYKCDLDHQCNQCATMWKPILGVDYCWEHRTSNSHWHGGNSACNSESAAFAVGEALGHDMKAVSGGTPATCEAPGKSAGSKCQRPGCNHTEGAGTISALGHDWVANAGTSADCYHGGTTGGEHCSRCTATRGTVSNTPSLDPVWDASCVVENGVHYKVCTACNGGADGHKELAGTRTETSGTQTCQTVVTTTTKCAHCGGVLSTSTGNTLAANLPDAWTKLDNTQHVKLCTNDGCSHTTAGHRVTENHTQGTFGKGTRDSAQANGTYVGLDGANFTFNSATHYLLVHTAPCTANCGMSYTAYSQVPKNDQPVYVRYMLGGTQIGDDAATGQSVYEGGSVQVSASAPAGYALADNEPEVKTANYAVDQDFVTVTFQLKANEYPLTINYVVVGGTAAAPAAHSQNVAFNSTYEVASPELAGYTVDTAKVADTMDNVNGKTHTVTYYVIKNPTVTFVDEAGNTISGPTTTNDEVKHDDTNVTVTVPDVPTGYERVDNNDVTVNYDNPDADVVVKAISYTLVVNYVDVDAENGEVLDTKSLGTVNIGSTYAIEDLSFTGYYQVVDQALNGSVDATLIAKADENNRIVLTVRYAKLGTLVVRWVNGTTELQTGSFYVGSDAPEAGAYSGATPTRASDGIYTYAFSGWSDGVEDENGNVTYTAQFSRTPIYYPPVNPSQSPEPSPTPTPTPEPSQEVEVPEPSTPLGPLPELPNEPEQPEEPIEVDEPETPLGPLPELPNEVEVEDPDVPLAAVPQTGDNTVLWATTAVASGAGLIWLAVDGKKRREDAE